MWTKSDNAIVIFFFWTIDYKNINTVPFHLLPVNFFLTGIAIADTLIMLEYIPFTVHMNIYDVEGRDKEEKVFRRNILDHSRENTPFQSSWTKSWKNFHFLYSDPSCCPDVRFVRIQQGAKKSELSKVADLKSANTFQTKCVHCFRHIIVKNAWISN